MSQAFALPIPAVFVGDNTVSRVFIGETVSAVFVGDATLAGTLRRLAVLATRRSRARTWSQ
jgi:hypothetical protein